MIPFPGKRWRTIASAQITPKTVFAGTAIAAISSVRRRACFAAGVVTASQAGPIPCSKVRQKTSPTGAASTTNRYESPRNRKDHLDTVVPRRPAPERSDPEQHGERDDQDKDGHSGRAGRVAALDPPEDEHRCDLGLEGQVPGNQHDRAEFAD